MFRKNLTRFYFILVCGLVLNSCKTDGKTEIVMYHTIFRPYNMTVDLTMVDTFIEKETYDVSAELEGDLARHNSTKDKISSAKLIELRIQIGEWAYQEPEKYSNLCDISEIEVDIKKNGIGSELIATKLVPDLYTRSFKLDLREIELKDYMKQDTLNLVIRYKKRRPMKNEMPIYIYGTFRIAAQSL
jgi:hypothetical protein